MKPEPPQNTLQKYFRYENGRLLRLDGTRQPYGPPNLRRTLKVPGYGQRFLHRMIWIFFNGPIPAKLKIDHKDRNSQNNLIENLRLATSSQQKMNKGCQSNNRSGLKGAYYHSCRKGKKWRSQIKVGPKLIFLGYYETPEEASAAHGAAAYKYFGEFYCPEFRHVPVAKVELSLVPIAAAE